jgi:hypothetical protein
MTLFEQAKARVIDDFQQRAGQAVAPRRRSSVYNTGKGGADHSYQLEENRRQAAQADRYASSQSAKWSSWAETIEELQSFEQYIAWLRRWLQKYGWTEIDEDYNVSFAGLKEHMDRTRNHNYEAVDVVKDIHCIMLMAAPARVIEDVESGASGA